MSECLFEYRVTVTDLQPVHSFYNQYVREQSHDSLFSERVLEVVVSTLDIGVEESKERFTSSRPLRSGSSC